MKFIYKQVPLSNATIGLDVVKILEASNKSIKNKYSENNSKTIYK
jgi:hypothetical protein